ncbi:YkvI family membrane protein [Alteriqipengyuania lutimaris]|uniref:Membrane protein YkvI n=1 Tax=Alteriqipengyuania lutimaris TaxID=1538146 RepID=A0A395LNF0_9SPHN|nr:hypothetical protein [Alteriqipengyuania lutimaris]MBB3032437.1 putative membrane protein YkvI [Alteriqipengyuania lutimaris]RDS78422.1 hypothetical protein DL238_12955 [Alteriqipengyuania lutimaris]
MSDAAASNGVFRRLVLPGLAFKAVVIGGGYATGREIAEFFVGSGPLGGLLGLLLAMAIWSIVCAVTFEFARIVRANDYRGFFAELLGPGWILFEIAYVLFMVLVIAVIAAAAGEIGTALFGWPTLIGTGLLLTLIIAVVSLGTAAAERMFRYSSVLIYAVYAVFLALALWAFSDQIGSKLASSPPGSDWALGGITYASYNVIGAVLILPFLRHQVTRRDALVSGLLAGPLAMLPALGFFLSMVAFMPEIGAAALPSDYLLARIGVPWFAFVFQGMIFIALLETGIGMVNALEERAMSAARERGVTFPAAARIGLSAAIVLGSGLLAAQLGLIDLIAAGYGAFGWIMLVLFVVPLLTLGTFRIFSQNLEAAPS